MEGYSIAMTSTQAHPCEIVTEDGTTLRASCDVTLAHLWAKHEVNALYGAGAFDALPRGERWGHIADALDALRTALRASAD
jgi:hypothetical protein